MIIYIYILRFCEVLFAFVFLCIYIYIYKETQMQIVLHRISGVLDT